jgi:hypothetical protein
MFAIQSANGSAEAQAPFIEQPSEWVPHTAVYMVSQLEPIAYQAEEREYVARDGSTRTESYGGASEVAVRIDNLRQHKHYVLRNGVWTVHPLREQINGGKPVGKLRGDVKPVGADDPRVSEIAHLGLRFYEMPYTTSGTRGMPNVVVSPDLNMRHVYQKSPNGLEKRLTSLTLGDPDTTFEPPAGVALVVSNEPGGKGRATAEEAALVREAIRQPKQHQ